MSTLGSKPNGYQILASSEDAQSATSRRSSEVFTLVPWSIAMTLLVLSSYLYADRAMLIQQMDAKHRGSFANGWRTDFGKWKTGPVLGKC